MEESSQHIVTEKLSGSRWHNFAGHEGGEEQSGRSYRHEAF